MGCTQRKEKISQTSFRTGVIKQMIKSAALDLSWPTWSRPSISGLELQLFSGRHFPRKIEGNTKNWISHLCKVCVPAERSVDIAIGQKHKRPGHETSYECAQCEVSFCVVPCFSIYHTQQHEDGYKHTVFYSSVIFFHTNIFSNLLPCNRTVSFLNSFRENFRVKTVLFRYQMYTVTL